MNNKEGTRMKGKEQGLRNKDEGTSRMEQG
jgi:hypothetical protein